MMNNTAPIRLLCVDDEPSILKALERVFFDDDYEIFLCGSCEEGLEVLQKSGSFQLVISDYRMPVMNGVEFLKIVYEKYPETVRIILSGYADAAAIVSAINDGHIYKFIPKPWNDDEFRVTVQNGVELYFLQQNKLKLLDQMAEANQILQEKVQQSRVQIELYNPSLELSQSLLGGLPVGVLGVDASGNIVYCNENAARLLKDVCSDFSGHIGRITCCDIPFSVLVAQVRRDKFISVDTIMSDVPCRILGCTLDCNGNNLAVLVFLEMNA